MVPTEFFKEILIETRDKKISQSWQKRSVVKKPIQVYFPEGQDSQSFSWIRAISVHLYRISYWEEQQLLSIDPGRRLSVEMPSCYRSENVPKEFHDSCVLWKYQVWQLDWILSNTTVGLISFSLRAFQNQTETLILSNDGNFQNIV